MEEEKPILPFTDEYNKVKARVLRLEIALILLIIAGAGILIAKTLL